MKRYTIALLVIVALVIGAHSLGAKSPQVAQTISQTETTIQPENTDNTPEEQTQEQVTETPAPEQATQPQATAPVANPTPVPQPAPAKVAAPAPKPATAAPAPAPTPRVVATGSNANPAPKTITDVNAVPKLTYANCDGGFATEFLCLLNNYRKANGKGAVSYNSTLSAVALKYSQYMQSANFFAHVAPDGTHYYERCAAGGISCQGENLAMGFSSAQNLFDMWRTSATHNANLLGPYTQVGLGVSGKYATLEFKW